MRWGTPWICLALACAGCLDPPSEGANDGATPAELIAWYPMDDEIVDGVVLDAAGGHDGQCDSCPALAVGRVGMAYLFDGVLDHIRVDDAPAFHTGAWTVAAWVFIEDGDISVIMSKPLLGVDASDNSWLLMRTNTGEAMFETTGDQLRSGDVPFQGGEWAHIAGVWDGARKRLYLNGGEVVSKVAGPVEFDERAMLIGIEEDFDFTHPLTGLIDDVRIYDGPLDAALIASLAAAR